jgi:prepilin-type N-terminal cleavage/methylation domain-containing protein/prepilin-type processing-associated H-X9-DG protein
MARRAFTLLELLVVIAVISILAAMLMPAVTVARRKAWATSCRSRLHNIGCAVVMHISDSGGYLPSMADHTGRQFYGQYSGSYQEVDFRAGFLSRYVSSDDQVWQCPAFRLGQYMPRAMGPTAGFAYNYHYLCEYRDNFAEVGSWWHPDYEWGYYGLHESVVRKSTTTVLFGDSATNWTGPLQENWYYTPPSQSMPWGLGYTHFRHSLRANVLWADGHVSSMGPDPVAPLDKDELGVLCDTGDFYFDPQQ